ncbi:MAG: DUF2007 domain-containing protein [Clostridia bacterium]|nr:DUF2007 domain-containing protein [Clostridia bacterium]
MDSLFGLDHPSLREEGVEYLTTAYSPEELLILESILQDAQIPYLKKDRGSGTTVKVIMGYTIFGTDLYVRPEDLDTATALLAPADAEEIEEEQT